MATARPSNTTDIGSANVVHDVNVMAFKVSPPQWAGEYERRANTPVRLTLTQHGIGFVLRLDGKPIAGLNAQEAKELGVGLIVATAR